MERLRSVGCGQLERLVVQARDREIPPEPPGGAEHGRQRHPPRCGDAPGHDPVQPGARAGAGDQVLAEIVHLVDAHALAHGPDLAPGGVPCVRAAKAWGLVTRLVPFGEPVHHLQPVLLAPDRAHGIKDVIHRRRVERTRRRQFLVGVRDREPFLIVLDHLRQGIAWPDPVAETRHVHRCDVAFAFARRHPLCQHQPDAAALAEPGHHAAGRPVVAQPRHRADQRVAVGGKGKGAVDHRLDPGAFQRGKAAIGKGDGILDLVEIVGQQFVPKGPGRAIHRPGATGLFVEPDAQPAPLLPQIAFAGGVHHVGVFAARVDDGGDLGHLVGDEVLMFHRVQRQIGPRHRAHLARPQPGGVDNMLGPDGALVGDHVPAAVGAGGGFLDVAMGFYGGPAQACGAGIGVGGAGGVEVAIKWVVKRADDAIGVGDRGEARDFLGADDLGLEAHVAVLGALGQQHVEAVSVVGQRDPADMVQPAGKAGQFLQFTVKPDGIALQCRHVGVAVEGVKAPRRVPGTARGQLGAFDQHHVRPAKLGQVIKHAAPDDSAADDADPGVGFHCPAPC